MFIYRYVMACSILIEDTVINILCCFSGEQMMIGSILCSVSGGHSPSAIIKEMQIQKYVICSSLGSTTNSLYYNWAVRVLTSMLIMQCRFSFLTCSVSSGSVLFFKGFPLFFIPSSKLISRFQGVFSGFSSFPTLAKINFYFSMWSWK